MLRHCGLWREPEQAACPITLERVNAWWLAEASLPADAPAEFTVENAAGLDLGQRYVAFGERLAIAWPRVCDRMTN